MTEEMAEAFAIAQERLDHARAAAERGAYRQAEILLDIAWWDVKLLGGLVRAAKRVQQRIQAEARDAAA